jgi:hypothetical protein
VAVRRSRKRLDKLPRTRFGRIYDRLGHVVDWYEASTIAANIRHVLRAAMFIGLVIYATRNDIDDKQIFLLAAFVLAAPELRGLWPR